MPYTMYAIKINLIVEPFLIQTFPYLNGFWETQVLTRQCMGSDDFLLDHIIIKVINCKTDFLL